MQSGRRAAVAVISSLTALSPGASAQDCLEWTLITDETEPRADHAMIFEGFPARLSIMAGGTAGTETPVDAWDGENWSRHSVIGIPDRSRHTLIGNAGAGNNTFVLFGGQRNGEILADTHLWDGQMWRLMDPPESPSARMDHAAASRYGVQNVLFGGWDGEKFLDDSWCWLGAKWLELDVEGPSARGEHAMALDYYRERAVLFGGWDGERCLGDTWEWDYKAKEWQLRASTGPAPRRGHTMVFAWTRRATILFGGRDWEGNLLSDCWEWDGGRWTELRVSGPSSREGHAMAFDDHRGVVVLHGGWDGESILQDTWELGHPADITRDGFVDESDVSRFLYYWRVEDSRADWNADRLFDVRDLIWYLEAWALTC